LIGAGCSAVLTVEPVGSEPVVLEPEQWDGVWCDLADAAAHLSGVRVDERDCLTLTVIDPEEGTLEVVDPTSREPEGGAIVRRMPGSDAMFLTIPYPPGVNEPAFWVRVRVTDGVLLFWEPKVDAFKALVEAGSLPGPLSGSKGENVVLFHLDRDALALMREQEPVLFEWEEPHVLVRVRH
jgi:hypothetical protein